MVDLPLSFYQWAWWLWIAAFVALETLAILDPKSGDTLTENVRPWLHAHPLFWLLAAAFLGWLFIHFLTPAVERWLGELSAPWRS